MIKRILVLMAAILLAFAAKPALSVSDAEYAALLKKVQDLQAQVNAMQQLDNMKPNSGYVKSKKENLMISTTGGGIKINSSNGNKFQIGGRLMFDLDSFDKGLNSTNGGSAEENEWRRSRIYISGQSGKHWSYKWVQNVDHESIDSEGEADEDKIHEAYIKLDLKPFWVQAGKFNLPTLLEGRTSAKWIETIERSVVEEVLYANGLVSKASFGGVALGFADKSLFGGIPVSGTIGIYDTEKEKKKNLGDDSTEEDSYLTGMRLSAMPSLGDKNHFMHFGVTKTSQDFEFNSFTTKQHLGIHTVASRTFTSVSEAGDVDTTGLEFAYQKGPFTFVAEDIDIDVDGADQSQDLDFDGYYLGATYFLTGESRKWEWKGAKFDKPSGIKNEWGAWQLVGRFEEYEIDNKALTDEIELNRTVLGVNWFPTKNVRVSLNRVHLDVDGSPGGTETVLYQNEDSADGWSFRLQYAM